MIIYHHRKCSRCATDELCTNLMYFFPQAFYCVSYILKILLSWWCKCQGKKRQYVICQFINFICNFLKRFVLMWTIFEVLVHYNFASVFMFQFFNRKSYGILAPWPWIKLIYSCIWRGSLAIGPPGLFVTFKYLDMICGLSGLNCSPQKICPSPNPWNVGMWIYMGKGSLQI